MSNLDGERLRSGHYSSDALEVDEDQTLTRIERGMPVRLIATLQNLVTTSPDELVIDVLEKKMKPLDFDFLPVRRVQTGHFIGIVSTEKLYGIGNDCVIADVYDSLGPDDLISAEASLLSFVWTADLQPRRLVLDGTDIRGIFHMRSG